MKIPFAKLTVVGVAFIFLGVFLSRHSRAELDINSVKGAWLLDEGGDEIAKDTSRNGNDGTLMNGPKWVEGRHGKALMFDGDGTYVEIPHDKSLVVKEAFSLAFWMTANLIPPGGTTRTLVSKNKWEVTIDNGTVRFVLKPKNEVCCKTLWGVTALKIDTWYHVACTYNNKHMILYIDGVFDGAREASGDISGTQDIDIGHDLELHGAGGFFDVIIDEVILFDVAITEDDVKSLMNDGVALLLPVSASSRLATVWGQIKNDQ